MKANKSVRGKNQLNRDKKNQARKDFRTAQPKNLGAKNLNGKHQ